MKGGNVSRYTISDYEKGEVAVNMISKISETESLNIIFIETKYIFLSNKITYTSALTSAFTVLPIPREEESG